MKTLLVAILLMVCACKEKPNFEAERQEFYNEANARGCIVQPVRMNFARLDDVAGYCVADFGILIDETLWQEFGPLQKKEVVFHELAHCVLGAEHTEFGLMTPSMHSEEELELMWDKYVTLLFKDCVTLSTIIDAINPQ